MEEYQHFKALAHAALKAFNVNVGTFYGCRETARATPADLYYLSVNGQGLPSQGFTVGREQPAAAVDAMVRQLKAHRRAVVTERLERSRRRQAETDAA